MLFTNKFYIEKLISFFMLLNKQDLCWEIFAQLCDSEVQTSNIAI